VEDDVRQQKPPKITKLAIGVDGGFNHDPTIEVTYEDIHSLIVYPEFEPIDLGNPTIPKQVIYRQFINNFNTNPASNCY
jgi:hypothetical protein